jgi:hypothetical protein
VAARRAAATATVDVRRLAPRVDGLAVQVSPGPVPVVFVSWTGDTPLVVLGAAGEPFARFEPSGVEVNRHSSIWIDNARARDQDVSGLVAEALAEPEWVAVSSAPSFSWLEPRGALRDRRTRTWRVPFETATGRPVLIAETKLVDIDK